MKTDASYIKKQRIQAGQYKLPYHWSGAKKVEARRYHKMTGVLVDSLLQLLSATADNEITLLDFGCGDGYGAYLIAKLLEERGVKARIYGVDVEAVAIDWAIKLTGDERSLSLEFMVGDIRSGVDLIRDKPGMMVVLMREVIEHLPENDIDEILRYTGETLPKAKILISVPSVNSPTEEKHFRHYTENSLRETLRRNGYDPVSVSGFGFRPIAFYWVLKRTKALLNRKPWLWWLMNPLWRVVRPEWAITLVAMAGRTND